MLWGSLGICWGRLGCVIKEVKVYSPRLFFIRSVIISHIRWLLLKQIQARNLVGIPQFHGIVQVVMDMIEIIKHSCSLLHIIKNYHWKIQIMLFIKMLLMDLLLVLDMIFLYPIKLIFQVDHIVILDMATITTTQAHKQ